MSYNYVFSNPTQPGAQFQCASGDVFTADNNGTIIITSPKFTDIENLINSGWVQVAAFGSGPAQIFDAGNLFTYASATGTQPGTINNDNVLAVYSLPAGSLDGIRNRELVIQANGIFGNNTNSKRVKIIVNPSAAVVGSTITGGTTIADTGAYTTTGAAGFQITGSLVKYGAPGSNTQLGMCNGVLIANASIGLGTGGNPQAVTAVESGAILIAITGNGVTATTDITLEFASVAAFN